MFDRQPNYIHTSQLHYHLQCPTPPTPTHYNRLEDQTDRRRQVQPPAASANPRTISDSSTTTKEHTSLNHKSNQNESNSIPRSQQPLCEAFIMTGQQMLKLTCDESGDSKNNNCEANKRLISMLPENSEIRNDHHHECSSDNESDLEHLDDTKRNSTVTEKTQNKTENMQQIVNSRDLQDQASKPEPENGCHMENTSDQAGHFDCPDREAARRLAKRLYNLSGFKRDDVCHHLAKNNPFSQVVTEEYLKLYDFRSMNLDQALRKFFSKLQMSGETQERGRVLSQFSNRYYDCNKEQFPNSDVVQTLVCALLLLNSDLHGNRISSPSDSDAAGEKQVAKLSLATFIDGLNGSLASKQNLQSQVLETSNQPQSTYFFPRYMLVDLYESVKKRPFDCANAIDTCDMTSFETELDRIYQLQISAGRSLNNGLSRGNSMPIRRLPSASNGPGSSMSLGSRRRLKWSRRAAASQEDEPETIITFKAGLLYRKRIFEVNGKPTSKGRRGWTCVHVTLQDLRIKMRRPVLGEVINRISQTIDPDADAAQTSQLIVNQTAKYNRRQMIAFEFGNTFKIHHCFAKVSTTYTKRKFVFHLKLANQSEILLQANDEQDLNSWVDTINFASACLSSPALPSAVANSNSKSSTKSRQAAHQMASRPAVPASYTKLTYWEQLIDHEERLKRLKVELDEHLAQAPHTRNASKQSKTQFIDRIALLRQDIERYGVYVETMRRRSNSPEAMILSRHAKVALSLQPSSNDPAGSCPQASSRATNSTG